MPFRKLFLSRWSALLWAGGVLWTAFDTVGFGPPAPVSTAAPAAAHAADPNVTDATGMSINAADLDMLANVMNSD